MRWRGLAPTGHWYPPEAPVTQCSRRPGVAPGWPVFSGESSSTAVGPGGTRACRGQFEDSLPIHRQSTGRPPFSPALPGPSTAHPQANPQSRAQRPGRVRGTSPARGRPGPLLLADAAPQVRPLPGRGSAGPGRAGPGRAGSGPTGPGRPAAGGAGSGSAGSDRHSGSRTRPGGSSRRPVKNRLTWSWLRRVTGSASSGRAGCPGRAAPRCRGRWPGGTAPGNCPAASRRAAW